MVLSFHHATEQRLPRGWSGLRPIRSCGCRCRRTRWRERGSLRWRNTGSGYWRCCQGIERGGERGQGCQQQAPNVAAGETVRAEALGNEKSCGFVRQLWAVSPGEAEGGDRGLRVAGD